MDRIALAAALDITVEELDKLEADGLAFIAETDAK